MDARAVDATLARLAVYPIKSLDPSLPAAATVSAGGALSDDRRWALFDADGRVVNAKRTARIHQVRAAYRRDGVTLSVDPLAGGSDLPAATFPLESPSAGLEAWLGEFLGEPVTLREDAAAGFPDDPEAYGPTLISTATLHAVASWFPGMTPESARLRFRANLEIDGVPAFWEDRLCRAGVETVLRVGGVPLRCVRPCTRCVVPSRGPRTGTPMMGFHRAFARRRAETLPDWADPAAFGHYFRLAVNTRIDPSHAGKAIRLGDPVRPAEPDP